MINSVRRARRESPLISGVHLCQVRPVPTTRHNMLILESTSGRATTVVGNTQAINRMKDHEIDFIIFYVIRSLIEYNATDYTGFLTFVRFKEIKP